MWPTDCLPLPADQIQQMADQVRPAFQSRCQSLGLEADLTPFLPTVYLPLAAWITQHQPHRPMVLGVNGAQGSGKSTLAVLLETLLTTAFHLKVTSFSIDDFYKTRAEREHLSRTVHPLLITRGVPGTHDVALGLGTLEALKTAAPGSEIAIPAFDKALDDRKPRDQWPVWRGPVDIILFEGWCVGARPQPDSDLANPINDLERLEDPDGRWRRYVNDQLKGPYQSWFAELDRLIMLKVPSMEQVFAWRLQQERQLAERYAGAAGQTLRLMNETQLRRFIQHFERLTRWMLKEMPNRADVVLSLNRCHQFNHILVNSP